MNWLSRSEPKTDGPSTEPLAHVVVDPEHKPEPEADGLTYEVERDKDGWPVSPAQNDRPLWK